ncbi:MAG TPA: hypothetical protein VFE62_18345, partial [Gemmataceae bacterium]|nr:hypothetical protein [Gemmataceae bacterium]
WMIRCATREVLKLIISLVAQRIIQKLTPTAKTKTLYQASSVASGRIADFLRKSVSLMRIGN